MKDIVLVYDVASVPDPWTITQVAEIWKKHNLVLWDSTKGYAPFFSEETDKYTIVDINSPISEEEGKIIKGHEME